MSNPELTPQEEEAPKVSGPKDYAGGLPAIMSVMRYAKDELGPIRGTEALLKVNQRGGFDCPGCAWPDPDDKRAMTEFCENGAKAIAEEATTKKVDPDFFKTYSVEELGRQSDYWLGKRGRLTHPMFLAEGASHYEPISWDKAYDLLSE